MLFALLSEKRGVCDKLAAAIKEISARDGEISVGSICSGWGVANMAVDALNSSLSRIYGYEFPKAPVWAGFWTLL